tara:strand:- start:149 stop:502 length:354 start_codon:yes stop_codon:yes gene_type:complete
MESLVEPGQRTTFHLSGEKRPGLLEQVVGQRPVIHDDPIVVSGVGIHDPISKGGDGVADVLAAGDQLRTRRCVQIPIHREYAFAQILPRHRVTLTEFRSYGIREMQRCFSKLRPGDA